MKSFHHVLINTLLANVTTSFLWFALTFWIYLETRSVLATGIIGGSYMALIAVCSLGFGVIVDHMRKKNVMMLSGIITFVAYLLAGLIWLTLPHESLLRVDAPGFWLFIGIILVGSVVENMRNIALSTTVTLLVPDGERDKANGLVGAVQGIAFMVTSVFSGLAIGFLGMGPTLLIALVATAIALAHLTTVRIAEPKIVASGDEPATLRGRIDLSGSIAAIRSIPGLTALILFATFNNLVGGVYMAIMDPYGLELLSPQAWGIVLGVTSTGFIIGGAIIAKTGLGTNPVRTLLLVNVGVAVVGATFAIRESWLLFAFGILVFMTMVPAAEAAEQTVLQRVVPYKRQGRVFGLAQSVETAASPLSAFLVAPLAEFLIIPWMNEDGGKEQLSWLLGDGQARGMALVFLGAGIIMLIAVLVAFASPQYRELSAHYAGMRQSVPAGGAPEDAPPDDAEADGAGAEAGPSETDSGKPFLP